MGCWSPSSNSGGREDLQIELTFPCRISYLEYGDTALPIWLFGEGKPAGGEGPEEEIKWLKQ